jgi:hypothetical protein
MIAIPPIYYDRSPHFRHDVVCSRSITPLTCGCRGRRLKPPARATSKNFYKIFQRLHDCKNFSETSERSRQPGHIDFSPVFPAYPAPPPTPRFSTPECSLHQVRRFPAGGRLTRPGALAFGTDRAARNRLKTSTARACWWLLGAVIAPITWSTSPNSRSRRPARKTSTLHPVSRPPVPRSYHPSKINRWGHYAAGQPI